MQMIPNMSPIHDETVARNSGPGQIEDTKPRLDADVRSQQKPPPKRTTKAVFIMAGIVAISIGAVFYYRSRTKDPATAGTAAGRADAVVPVVAGVVASKDVPIYLDGLGTVQAFNTVSVHTRVDGQLMSVGFTEGQDVKTGDVLAQIDPAPYQAALDQAVARKAQDEAQFANAGLDLKRYIELLKTDSITPQIHDTQKSLLAQLGATVKADQAAIDIAQVNLDYTTIRSPIDGRAGLRQMDQGNIVHASDANGLVIVSQLRPISVVFTLPEQILPKLQDHADDFTVLAVARDNTNVLTEGRLAVVDNQIDTTTGTIKLKATFANENLRLWPGQFVNTRLLLATRKNGVVVPASVVQRGPEGAFAFVIEDDQSVAMRPLKVAQIEKGEALIDDGVKPGEHVVVDGQYKLQPGSHVKTVEPSGGGSAPKTRAKNREGARP